MQKTEEEVVGGEPVPPAMVRIREGEVDKEVPLLDVEGILGEHLKEYPLELPSGRGALVFRVLAYEEFLEIREKHRDWLKGGGEENEASAGLLLEKTFDPTTKKTDIKRLTPEEQALLENYGLESFPYSSELIWTMLVRPKMSLEQFRQLIKYKLSKEDWKAIERFAGEITSNHYLDLKN